MSTGLAGRDLALIGLGLLAVVVLAVVAALCRQQALAWVQPPRSPGADTVPPDAPPGTEDGTLAAPDGVRLRYWFVPAEGPAPRPAVVLVHGLLANRDVLLPRAALLARHGIAVLALELRAHGGSGGAYTTLGIREADDVGAALAHLAARSGIDRTRLALVGHSLGAVTALRAAAAHAEVRAVVAESPFVSVEAVAPTVIRGLTGRRPIPSTAAVLWAMDRLTGSTPSTVRADHAVRRLRCPVLVVHGTDDEVAPVEGGRTLAALAAAGQLFEVEGGGHADPMRDDPAGYSRRVLDFLAAVL